MTDSPEPTTTPQADSASHGDELVTAAVVLALITFAGRHAVGVLLFTFVTWQLKSGSRAAYWLLSLAALGWGLVQLSDIVKGSHGDQYLSDWILIWTRCLCGFVATLILWLRKDARRSFRRALHWMARTTPGLLRRAMLPLILIAAFVSPFAYEFWIGPAVGEFGTCHCQPDADGRTMPSSGLAAHAFPLRVVDDRDLQGRSVYEIADVGVDPSRYPRELTRRLRDSGALCRHESLRADARNGTARLATKRGRDALPELVDRISLGTHFMPCWDELVIRTRREPGAAVGTWETIEDFTTASFAEATAALQSRYPGASELPEDHSGPPTKSAALRTSDGSVVTLRLNPRSIAPNARYAEVLRCYDANDRWSWQATDLPPGSGRVWACDLDGDGADEAVTVVWHDVDKLFVQVRRHISG